jgi:prepilin-type N-terminal cleavage/methylation domain-containing protein
VPLATPSYDDRSERGFTLVELVVSLTVLAIGIVGVIGVMNSSFSVSVRTSQRSRAVALATRELEALRAVPYKDLTVSTSTTTRTESVGGTTYTISKAVTWGSQGADAQAVKNAVTAVSWADAGGKVYDVSQSTVVYPGGLGPSSVTTTTAACSNGGTPSGPTAIGASLPGLLTDSAVDLTWTPPLSSATAIATWRIEMSTDSFVTSQVITTTHPVSSVLYRVQGLSAATSYKFRVAGVSACGKVSAYSPLATITTAASSPLVCSLGTPNVTPAGVKLTNGNSNSALESTPTVWLNTTGPCSGLYVKYQAVFGTYRTQFLGGATSVKYVGITATGPWDIGVHGVDLYDGANVKRASLLLTVCAHNASSCP